MIRLEDKANCCGCSACSSVCPKQCITMKADREGFMYPVIDEDKCIDCGLCEKVCPCINREKEEDSVKKSYVIRNNKKDILMNSPSGGVFTSIAEEFLKDGAVIYGSGFDDDWVVRHFKADTMEKAERFRGSKYVQSDVTGVFQEIKALLDDNVYVVFSGTPCQVDGLKNYLRKDYDNLFTVDVICHGVPSPLLWEKYRKYQEKKFGSKLKESNFRNKTYGYHSGSMKLTFENGKSYYGSARVDYMLKPFFREISSRPSCYDCPSKKVGHSADMSLYDCWNADKLLGTACDDCGYTNVLVHTQKGLKVVELLKKYCFVQEVDTKKAIALDGPMITKSAVPHKKRDQFYSTLQEKGIEKTIEELIPISKKDYIIERVKRILHRLGIINLIRKLRDKMAK